MSTKHFVNDPTKLVLDSLRSLTLTNPSLAFDSQHKIVYLRHSALSKPQVSIISGGGSGHEPAYAGYVGRGFLSGSVAGTIFASPSAEQVYRAIVDRVDNSKGVIVVTMNYTGDVLNFGLAVERAKAKGVKAELVVMADDVGVGRKRGGKVGRRGIAGGILTLKIACALAAKGGSFDDIIKLARQVSANTVSLGASLERVHVPGRAPPDPNSVEALGSNEIELGMGIHNEAGSTRVTLTLDKLITRMLSELLDMTDTDRAFLKVDSTDEVVLVVNNLGGVSILEMGAIVAEAASQLEKDYGLKPVRVYQGNFITSLNGLGFSLSLCKLEDTGLGKTNSMLGLLDTDTEVTAWPGHVRAETWSDRAEDAQEEMLAEEKPKPSGLKIDPIAFKKVLSSGLHKVIAAEPEVTKYDTIVGDGDCGIGLKRGAEAILEMLDKTQLSDDALLTMWQIIPVVENSMDGTSGALYAIFLNALAHGLRIQDTGKETAVTPQIWAAALKTSLTSLGKYTPAQPGDRTLMDALYPYIQTFSETGDLKKAAVAGRKGADSTQGMRASLGRTVYVGGEDWQKIPDPGAYGLAEFLEGLADSN
ncbi:MAG: hypothetical protein M1834_004803 [Cirrosporium novae-zelandiae]|nr:MAG: hypothetical protein M1834_004803 [Cirrosporium novae-zelandiae]